MASSYINRIATAVPPHDVHDIFIDFAARRLSDRDGALFSRMAAASGIDHRYSCLEPAAPSAEGAIDREGLYRPGVFADTGRRMRIFERFAPDLAISAVERLEMGSDRAGITHLILTCCTGFAAPGLDLDIVRRCALPSSVERVIVGFMGCHAAVNALRLADHIVRSAPRARVLIVNIELCTLHLQETAALDKILSFMIFADGCAAAIVSAEPAGLAIDGFHSLLAPDSRELISWHIGNSGFDMILSGQVPGAVQAALRGGAAAILAGGTPDEIELWAVHPGGRSVLDAVERALDLPGDALAVSRDILRRFGNMSSASVVFVLQRMLAAAPRQQGCALAFGPGLTAESMLFHVAG